MPIRLLPSIVAALVVIVCSASGHGQDLSPGEKKWEWPIQSAVVAAPALGTNGLLYTVTSNGDVLALNVGTGQQQWKTNLGGHIYITTACYVGPEGNVYIGRQDKLYAFNGDTGAARWTHTFEGFAGYNTGLAIGPDGTIYVAAGYLYALEPATGAVRWEWEADYVSGTPMLAANGLLFISGGFGKVIAVSTTTGQRVWEYSQGEYQFVPMAVGRDGTLFASAWQGMFIALDGATGEQRWHFQTNDWAVSNLVIDSAGTLYLSGTDNTLRVLNGVTGTLQREMTLPSASSMITLTADRTLYVGGYESSTLFALNLDTGSTNWTHDPGGYVSINLASDGSVIFGTGNGICALHGSSPLADSPWPRAQQNAQNSGYWNVSGSPQITRQPQSHWAAAEASTTLRFYSPTVRPLAVQWFFNNQPIPHGTNESFQITRVQFTNAGSYSVLISNQFGQAMSAETTLSVGYAVHVTIIGPGSVLRSPDLPVYPTNTVVTLTAVAQEGRPFLGWSGAVTSSVETLTLTMDRNYELLASFHYLPGDVKWKARLARGTHALGPNGWLYSPSSRDSILAINPANGQVLWETILSANVETPPAVGPDGTVYIGDYGGNLWALDGTTGSKKWRFNFLGICLHTCPAFGVDGTLYLTGDRLCAVDPESGEEFWSFEGAAGRSPVVGPDGTLYAVGLGGLYAFEAFTHRIKWQVRDAAAPPALGDNGTLYIGCVNDQLRALDTATGSNVWVFSMPIYGPASPIIGPDNTVYCYAANGSVYALDGNTGAKKWDFFTGEGTASTPALTADGTLYVASYDRKLYALDASTGEEKWSLALDGAHYGEGGPTISPDGTIYVAGHALHGTSPLAPGPWPRFRRSSDNRGRPPVRPVLNPVRSRMTTNGFQLVNHSEPGDVLNFDWSLNLTTWNFLVTVTNNPGTSIISDTNVSNGSHRFYRANKQP